MTIGDKLVGLLNQKDHNQIHHSTRQIIKKTGLIQVSIMQIMCIMILV